MIAYSSKDVEFGSPETLELVPADIVNATELWLVRVEEFCKNAVAKKSSKQTWD